MTLMKPLKTKELPKGENTIYELKYDGGSSITKIEGKKVEVYHGDRQVVQTHKYPEVFEELKSQKDGKYVAEIVVIDPEHPGGNFNNYQRRLCENFFKIQRRAKKFPVTFVLHDVIDVDEPFQERRKILKERITPTTHVKVIEAYKSPKPILDLQKKYGTIEGIVAKDIDSKYRMDTRVGWWKKRFNVEEVVKVIQYEDWTKSDGTPGIVMTTDDGKRINLAGPRQHEAKAKIDATGFAMIEIAYHKVSDKGFRFTTVKRIL